MKPCNHEPQEDETMEQFRTDPRPPVVAFLCILILFSILTIATVTLCHILLP